MLGFTMGIVPQLVGESIVLGSEKQVGKLGDKS